MKRHCNYCGRESLDGNMWCPWTTCPAGDFVQTLAHGETINDMEIVQMVRLLRNATLFEVVRNKNQRKEKRLLVKVAHRDDVYEDLLKEEAKLLKELRVSITPRTRWQRLRNQVRRVPLALPKLQPIQPRVPVATNPYSSTLLGGEIRYFYVFEYQEGVFLDTLLASGHTMWHEHASFLVSQLATAIHTLQKLKRGRYTHNLLNPEHILVRFDRHNIPRPLLIDLGMTAYPGRGKDVTLDDLKRLMPIQYLPEPISAHPDAIRNAALDTYGLGLLMRELLTGGALMAHQRLSERDVIRGARPNTNGTGIESIRKDLQNIAFIDETRQLNLPPDEANHTAASAGNDILTTSMSVVELRNKLDSAIGEVPPEPRAVHRTRRWLWWGVFALLALLVILVGAYYLELSLAPRAAA